MSSREIAIWVDERWYQALSRQLKDETVEGRLNNYLDELIDQLPEHVRDKISNEIWVEQQKQKQEIEDSKKYSVFRVTEDGVTEHFQVEQAVDMLGAASCVRRWLRQAEHHPFQEMLSGRENIYAEEFDRIAVGRVTGDGKITGVYDVNLDVREFSAVRPDLGWLSYRLKDVSTASWHSYRTGSYDKERRQARFTEKLAGKEIASAGHLSAKNFAFADEITADDGCLNFYLENSFDVDRVFGMRTAKGDDWLNVYASYDMAAGQVCDMLEVDLHRADSREESVEYYLNAVEKAVLLRKMDAYCQQQTGQSLTDYSAQCMAEDIPYIHFTDDQKRRAGEVDLEQFLLRQGEKLLASGFEKRLASDNSITIRGNRWYDHAAEQGGGPISFVQQFYNLSYPEAVTCLLGGEQGVVYVPASKQEMKEKKAFALPPANRDMRRMYAYLLKNRFLDRDVVSAFVRAGVLYESCEKFKGGTSEYHNVVFVGKDTAGAARHAHKRSINSIGKTFRINVEGSDPRCSFHHTGSSERLYVFEAPIDLLSFITLYRKDWQRHSYVALCGTAEHAMLWMLEQNPGIRTVCLCLDHDAAGIEAGGRLTDILWERGYDMSMTASAARPSATMGSFPSICSQTTMRGSLTARPLTQYRRR